MLMFITELDVATKYIVTFSFVYLGTTRPNKSFCMNIPSANKTTERVLIVSRCKQSTVLIMHFNSDGQ